MVIEHNLDVIKSSDWVIDLGPEGGAQGGTIVATGTPEQVARNPRSFTGKFLARVLKNQPAEQQETPSVVTAPKIVGGNAKAARAGRGNAKTPKRHLTKP